jgi:hypothetical protein
VGRYLSFGWDSTRSGPISEVHLEKLRARRIVRRLVARGGSGDIQAQELLAPQIDGRGRIVWIRSLFGDSTRSAVERYSVLNGNRDSAPLQPVAGEAFIRTVIASAVDGTTPLYLGSGLLPPGEPCSPQAPCFAGPGCSDVQLCELRSATGLAFTRPERHPAR